MWMKKFAKTVLPGKVNKHTSSNIGAANVAAHCLIELSPYFGYFTHSDRIAYRRGDESLRQY